MKTCSVCNIEKPKIEFTKNGRSFRSTCKMCDAIRAIQEKSSLRNYVNGLKTKCKRCEMESFIPDLFDFHHIDPSLKQFAIATFCSSRRWSPLAKQKVDEEMEKCVLLCANCHREFHYLDKTEGCIDINKFMLEKN